MTSNEDPTQHELERAAARAVLDASALLNQAHIASRLTQQDLAEVLGVSPGRVSQVLNGDGNVRLSTLAKFLRATGYRLRLSAEPMRRGLSVLPKKRRRAAEPKAPRYVAVESIQAFASMGLRAALVEDADIRRYVAEWAAAEAALGGPHSKREKAIPSELPSAKTWKVHA